MPDGAEAGRFARFCVVGGAGFLADAGVLLALVHGLAADPVAARVVSFAVAVVLTFLLNRHWSFADAGGRGGMALFATYLGVQGVGFACNFVIYALLVWSLPPPWDRPLFCLALASAAALLVNYIGARHVVFGSRERPGD